MISINGIAHVMINVSHWEDCCEFYHALLPFFGMKLVFSGKDTVYYVGGRTALGINRVYPPDDKERFNQKRVGLHHLCFRAKHRKDIDISKLKKYFPDFKPTKLEKGIKEIYLKRL